MADSDIRRLGIFLAASRYGNGGRGDKQEQELRQIREMHIAEKMHHIQERKRDAIGVTGQMLPLLMGVRWVPDVAVRGRYQDQRQKKHDGKKSFCRERQELPPHCRCVHRFASSHHSMVV